MEVKDLDCLYEPCPIPLVRASQELKKMKTGDIVVLHSDQSCIGVMAEEWAKQNNYEIKVIEVDNGEWEVYIQK